VGASFRVLLKVEIPVGTDTDFEQEWRSAAPAVAGHPANRGHWLSRSDQEANTYYVISDWVDEPTFREFESSETHLAHRKRMHPFRVSGSMATMRILAGHAQ